MTVVTGSLINVPQNVSRHLVLHNLEGPDKYISVHTYHCFTTLRSFFRSGIFSDAPGSRDQESDRVNHTLVTKDWKLHYQFNYWRVRHSETKGFYFRKPNFTCVMSLVLS